MMAKRLRQPGAQSTGHCRAGRSADMRTSRLKLEQKTRPHRIRLRTVLQSLSATTAAALVSPHSGREAEPGPAASVRVPAAAPPPPRAPPHPPPSFAAALRKPKALSRPRAAANLRRQPAAGSRALWVQAEGTRLRSGLASPLAGRETEARGSKQLPQGAQSASARPVRGPRVSRLQSAIPRPHAPPAHPERGWERLSAPALARERAGRQTRPTRCESCCRPACPRLSPPGHTFPLVQGPCAHIRSTLRTPLSALPRSPSPPRPLAHSHRHSGRSFPASPLPRPPRRARGGFWRPGAPAPDRDRDPLPPARRGAEAGVAAPSARSAGGVRRGAQRRGEGALARSLSAAHTPGRMMNKLYIGNLSPAVTADDLRQLFGDRKLPLAGQVLLKSGYAFVDYPDQNWAIRAIETLSAAPQLSQPARSGGRPLPSPRGSGHPLPSELQPCRDPVSLRGSPRLPLCGHLALSWRPELLSRVPPPPYLAKPRSPRSLTFPSPPGSGTPQNPASPPLIGPYPFPCLVPRIARPPAYPELYTLFEPPPHRAPLSVPHFRHPSAPP
ncbi:Insulin-like growth factor 2 mRNA-binding protein 2 [Galemys pyrenaicus]|uniref:Insulin-like growth factor 2 mRNA-binding protein 2 n=1 Tax=Galemys pyrenaicus TaxID=202257 RepID=A0A8J6ACT2_GALPY|nr:Insulin-like growth factor 2 mRNA-binding protein 2 [Galemys pyrenaicus]